MLRRLVNCKCHADSFYTNIQGMGDLICQAFNHVGLIGRHVEDGHYDLMGPNGEIILPQLWETVIEPGWAISMHMWPMEEPQEPAPTDGENLNIHEPETFPLDVGQAPDKSKEQLQSQIQDENDLGTRFGETFEKEHVGKKQSKISPPRSTPPPPPPLLPKIKKFPKSRRRSLVRPSQGDMVLLNYLGNSNHPDVPEHADSMLLDCDSLSDSMLLDYDSQSDSEGGCNS